MRTSNARRFISTVLIFSGSLLLLHNGCENDVDLQYEPQLNVFGVLSNLQQSQEIIVDRTYRIDEPAGPVIDDAFVVLSRNNFSDTLEFSYANERYISGPFTLLPEVTHELLVVKEGFDTLHAATTMPGNFTIFFPVYGDTLTLQDTIRLTQSIGAALYSIAFTQNTGGYGPFAWHEPDPSDTLIQIPVGEYWDEPVEGYFTIYIAAYDSNFYDYYFAEDDSIIQAGVTGGVGLFGSTWTRVTSSYVLFQ